MRARSGALRPSLALRIPWHCPHPFFAYTSHPASSAQSGANGSGGCWAGGCCARAGVNAARKRQLIVAMLRDHLRSRLIRTISCGVVTQRSAILGDGSRILGAPSMRLCGIVGAETRWTRAATGEGATIRDASEACRRACLPAGAPGRGRRVHLRLREGLLLSVARPARVRELSHHEPAV